MRGPPLLLCLETTGPCCSVGVFSGEELLGHHEVRLDRAHARLLPDLISHVLSALQIDKKMLSAVALSGGPGSYTGLRIGSSIAKGLCYGLDIPLLVISTLAAMCEQVTAFVGVIREALLCPWLPARAGTVYYALYRKDGTPIVNDAVLHMETHHPLTAYESQGICFVGGEAQALRDVLPANEAYAWVENIYPTVRSMGKIAYRHFKAERFVALGEYESTYLSDFFVKPPPSHKKK